MNRVPFILSVASAALCLVLSVWLFFTASANQGLQSELQKRQQELQNQQQKVQLQQQQLQAQQQQIEQGNVLSQQVGPAVLRDLGSLAVQNKNEKIRGLLAKYGFTISEATPAPTGSAAAAATPAPAATPRP
jgi:mannitol-specific phosphotransferase system IIBC component